jgi:hypothetical protein
MAYIGVDPNRLVSLILYEYTATSGQTTFSGSDDNSATLSYTADNLQVVMNGIVLDPSDFTATNGTSVVLATGAATGSLVNIYAFKSFTVADTVSASAGGTFSANVAITGDLTVDTNTLHVDAANNRVAIGGTSPSQKFVVTNAGADNIVMCENSSASIQMFMQATSSTGSVGTLTNHPVQFLSNNTERMRLTDEGQLFLGHTSALAVERIGLSYPDSRRGIVLKNITSTNGSDAMLFANTNGTVGTINTNGSSTSYNTSSDYRLKEAVVDMTGAIDRVKALAPKRFNFIVDPDTTVDGFLAHEAQTVVPEAVTGTHNEVETWTQQEIDDGDAPDGTSAGDNKLDGDGNTIPVMQGIDQSKLVPLLTGALQEAIAKIETLETKVAALEAGS